MTKKIIFAAIIALLIPTQSKAACAEAPDMGANFYRCENKEAVCYFFSEGQPTAFQISCFRTR